MSQSKSTSWRLTIVRDLTYQKTACGADVDEFLNVLETERGRSPKTLESYGRQLAKMCVRHPLKRRRQFTKADMRDEINSVPPASRRKVNAILSSFWTFMLKEGYVEVSPMRGIDAPPRRPRRVYDVFSEQEERQLIDLGPDARFGAGLEARDRLLMLLLLRCGIRIGELRTVRVRDIDVDARWVTVTGKGTKTRIVPYRGEPEQAVHDFLTTLLPRLERLPIPSDYVLYATNVTGGSINIDRELQLLSIGTEQPVSEATAWRWWRRCATRSGVRYRNPHMTRHTYATKFLRATKDLKALQDALGHADLSSTQVYVHTEVSDIERAVEQLEAVRAAQPTDLRAYKASKQAT